MRIFVTGATTLIGRSLVPLLLQNGHDVIGLARNDASRSLISAMRASAYSGQGYDTERLAEALEPIHAIVHLATSMPTQESAVEDEWAHSQKIIVGMLNHLLEASEQTGVRTIVFPSFHGVYGDHGDQWVSETASLSPDYTSEAYREAEELLLSATAVKRSSGIILRMGMVYAADAIHTGGLLYALRRGQAPIGGGGSAYWPQIHVSDAAQSILLALENSPSGEIFNICDNEPVQKQQLFVELAEQVGGPPPAHKARTGELSPYLGQIRSSALHFSVRMSNKKARQQLGFDPQYPTYREGYATVIEEWAATQD